jgi:hypothetical protein
MRILVRFVLGVLALTAITPGLVAQRGMFQAPELQGMWNPVAGAGGSYETQSKTGEKSHMDIFLLGKDTLGGKDAYWIEIAMPNPKSPDSSFVIKSLYSFDGTTLETSKVIMQIGGRPPMEVPMQASSVHKITPDIRSKGTNVGAESITTPSGTFACEHWRSEDGSNVWVSAQVPPYGLVKSESKDGGSLVLVKVITNAKDRIVGTPQPMMSR